MAESNAPYMASSWRYEEESGTVAPSAESGAVAHVVARATVAPAAEVVVVVTCAVLAMATSVGDESNVSTDAPLSSVCRRVQ